MSHYGGSMKSNFALLFILTLSVCFFIRCSSNDPQNTATLSVQLTDAPDTYEAVNISFTEIAVKVDSDWVPFLGEPQTIDLLSYSNGATLALGELEVPAGHIIQVRFKIDSANIVVDGVANELDVPSGSSSGLKFNTNFVLEPGEVMELIIDFDIGRSVHTTGPKNNPTGYKLQPVIRVAEIPQTGSITGTVTNYELNPIAYAIQTNDTVTSSIVSTTSGEFTLAFLPEFGSYKVVVIDDEEKLFEQEGVSVTGGQSTDLGDITLQ